MTPRDLSFDEIAIGDTAEFSRTWKEDDVEAFAKLSGDNNPLHMDDAYAKTTPYGKRLVHGMLLGSLCSALVGVYLPGKRCLYLSQNLLFRNPAFIGDTTAVRGVVTSKSMATKMLTIMVTISKDATVVAEGEARVKVI